MTVPISTPYILDDGDHLHIVIKQVNDQWVLSDEGHTSMRIDHQPPPHLLAQYGIQDHDGELIMPLDNAINTFAQALLRIIKETTP